VKPRAPDPGAVSDAGARSRARAEVECYRALNAVIERAVRAGCGSPGLFPSGFVVVETVGEKSGRPRRVPLLATLLDGCLFVSTLRGARAQWVRNLRAAPEARYWVGGSVHLGRARLFIPGEPRPDTTGLPPLARFVADVLLPPATAFGWTVAVIGARPKHSPVLVR